MDCRSWEIVDGIGLRDDGSTQSQRPTATDTVRTPLRAHPGGTAAELAHAADLAYSTTSNLLALLRSKGQARRDGGGQRPGQRGRSSYAWWPIDLK